MKDDELGELDLGPAITGMTLPSRHISTEFLESMGFRPVVARASTAELTVQPRMGPIPFVPIVSGIAMTAPDATTNLKDLPMEVAPFYDTELREQQHLTDTVQALADGIRAIDASVVPAPVVDSHTTIELKSLVDDPAFREIVQKPVAGYVVHDAESNVDEPVPVPFVGHVADTHGRMLEQLETTNYWAQASLGSVMDPLNSNSNVIAAKHLDDNPKLKNSGISGIQVRQTPVSDTAQEQAEKDGSLYKPGQAVVVAGGVAETKAIVKALQATEMGVTQVDLDKAAEHRNKLLTDFIEATDRAVQLGFTLDIKVGSKPAPEQLMDWLNDENTPPSYMQLVLEVLSPESDLEPSDLFNRLKEARKIADIVEPQFNVPEEELDEFQKNHLDLWREQARIKKARLDNARATLAAVTAVANADPVWRQMGDIFGRSRRSATRNSNVDAKSPDQIARERQQRKEISMHNYQVDQRNKAKAAKKAAKKFGKAAK